MSMQCHTRYQVFLSNTHAKRYMDLTSTRTVKSVYYNYIQGILNTNSGNRTTQIHVNNILKYPKLNMSN